MCRCGGKRSRAQRGGAVLPQVPGGHVRVSQREQCRAEDDREGAQVQCALRGGTTRSFLVRRSGVAVGAPRRCPHPEARRLLRCRRREGFAASTRRRERYWAVGGREREGALSRHARHRGAARPRVPGGDVRAKQRESCCAGRGGEGAGL